MPKIILENSRQLKDVIGREVVGDWLVITQAHIDLFAEATGDRQWIHLDTIRAAEESPFGKTIAHGFLTLSLLVRLLSEAIEIAGIRIGVNYGFNKIRFTDVVPAGARVRGRFVLESLENIPENGVQAVWSAIMEREGSNKPCLVAQWLIQFYD